MTKILNYLGWASGIFGALLMLGGAIGFLIGGEFLGVSNFYNWFFIANSFLFLGIFLVIVSGECCCCAHHEKKV